MPELIDPLLKVLGVTRKPRRDFIDQAPPQPTEKKGETLEDWKKSIQLDKYQLGGKFAQEGEGEIVRLATEEKNAPRLLAKRSARKGDIQREANYYQLIGSHPNFVRCLGVQPVKIKDERKEEVLVLEQIEGKHMQDTMLSLLPRYNDGSLSHEQFWGSVQYMVTQILQGLAHLEQLKIVHDDLKAKNIMVSQTGEVKIIDLGTAVESGMPSRKDGDEYTSPESQGKQPLDPRADIFSLARSTEWAQLRSKSKIGSTYLDFIQWLTDPSKEKRPTATEALKHPFLADMILNEEKSREVLQKVLTPSVQVQPTGGTFKLLYRGFWTPPIAHNATAAEIQQILNPTMENHQNFDRGSLKVEGQPGGPFTVNYSCTYDERTYRETAAKLIADCSALLPPGATVVFQDICRVIKPKGQISPAIEVKITPGFDRVSWEKTLGDAIALGAIPDVSGIVSLVSEALARVPRPQDEVGLLAQGDSGAQKLQAGLHALEEILKGTGNLLIRKEFKEQKQIAHYLVEMYVQAQTRKQALDVLQEKPAKVITTDFKGTWQTIKKEAEKGFKEASKALVLVYQLESKGQKDPKAYLKEKLAQVGLDKAKSAQALFNLWDNFSDALADFEKALSRKAPDAVQRQAHALEVAGRYFQNVASAPGFRGPGLNFGSVKPDFQRALLTGLKDLMHSIQQKK